MKIIEPYGFIYITTNMINGKRYIGQRKFSKGWKSYLGSGKILKQAIEKDGRENFIRDIISIAYSKEELDRLEYELIEIYNANFDRNFYNLKIGGEGGSPGGESHYNAGKRMSEEQKLKISETMIRNKVFRGNKNPMFGKNGVKNVRVGYKYDVERRNKMSKSKVGKNNPRAKKVICITTGKVFDTMKEGAEFYGVRLSNLSKSIKNKRYCGIYNDTLLMWEYYKGE